MNNETNSDTRPETFNFNPIVNHFTRKSEVARSIVEGLPVKALCGVSWVVKAQSGGRVSRTTNGVLITCPLCDLIYESIPLDGDGGAK